MSEKYIIDGSTLTNTADAIRAKTGETSGLDPADFPAKVDAVFTAGEKSEYDRFWDRYQDYGNRTNYDGAFGGTGWTEETFKPKYIPMRLSGDAGYQMFSRSSVGKIDESIIETSEVKSFPMSFYYFFPDRGHNIYYVSVDCSSLALVNNTFDYNHTLRTLVMKNIQETCNFVGGFNGCDALTDFTVTGTIGGTNLDLHWSTLLTEESVLGIVSALSTTTTGSVLTLPLAWSERYIAAHGAGAIDELMATRPNWTILVL